MSATCDEEESVTPHCKIGCHSSLGRGTIGRGFKCRETNTTPPVRPGVHSQTPPSARRALVIDLAVLSLCLEVNDRGWLVPVSGDQKFQQPRWRDLQHRRQARE